MSLYFAASTGPTTWHPLALTTNYIADANQTGTLGDAPYGATTTSWYFLAGADIIAPAATLGIVAFGASTSDGMGSTANTNQRWADDLNDLDQARQGGAVSVVDEGIAGNCLLSDGGPSGWSGDARFARDALSQAGVGAVIISLGNDDIGNGLGPDGRPITAAAIVAGYEQLIANAHASGLEIIGATLTPDRGAAFSSPAGEAIHDQVNTWILTSGAFDATVDLAAALGDPRDPATLLARYDSGDHLHLNDAGYQAMADAISLTILVPKVSVAGQGPSRARARRIPSE